MGSIGNFLEGISKGKLAINTPWEHANSMLKADTEVSFDRENYARLMQSRALLGNIGDDHLMLLNQNDFSILVAAYEVAMREPEFRPVFKYMLNSWTGSLSLTRTKNGRERDLQATPGGAFSPNPDFEGYGSELDFTPQEQGGELDKYMKNLQMPKTKQPKKMY